MLERLGRLSIPRSAPLAVLAKIHLDQGLFLLYTKGLEKASKAAKPGFCIDTSLLLLELRGPILGTSSPKLLQQWAI